MSNKQNAKLYLYSTLGITAFFIITMLGTIGLNAIILKVFHVTFVTLPELCECFAVIALILAITVQIPLMSIALIYYKLSKGDDTDDTQ